ncbi:MAG: serine/threonine-protein kinase [Myxococcales bacterium]|nr:serine/threonine-protein kinase [Myxococcales bacterium]
MADDPAQTLDELWTRLKLDSLPADAGANEDLRATRTRDWAQDTLRADRHEVITERVDLPRISLTPPGVESQQLHQDLVVVGVLGEGGMGRVLLARQQSLGRNVAVKIARPNLPEKLSAALLHEGRTMGSLEHPCIVPVYALASDDGRPALVMKRIDGVAWSHLLADPGDPAWSRLAPDGGDHLEANVSVLIQVCNAIAFAHRNGVIHRDLKPSNVLIGDFGEVYVADWGVATTKPAPGEQRKPSLIGTPVYLAPEMVTGDDAQMDERTDIFLLGAILFEVLARRPPWGGADLKSVLREALECSVPSLPSTAPEELVEVCRKAMARSPNDRYADALQLRDALLAWRRHRGSVELARAAHQQLDELLSVLRSGSKDRVVISPLLSASRFGFAQALKDWPENELAKAGLHDSIEAAARFELGQGNLEAGRALVNELDEVPPSLREALHRVEASAAERARRDQKVASLARELDPMVSESQRRRFTLLMVTVTAVVVVGANFSDAGNALRTSLGEYSLTVLMGLLALAYSVSLVIGRKALLATRLNRQVAGILGIAFFGPLIHRLLAVQIGSSRQDVMMSDLVMTAAIAAAGGLMLHRVFYFGAAAFLAGAFASVVFIEHLSVIYALAAISTQLVITLSWKKWRSELDVK